MKLLRTLLQRWSVSFVISLVLIGYPLYGQAMSLFMGVEEPKQSAPPPKPVAAKPQPVPGQSGAKTADQQSAGAPAQAIQGAPIPAANAPKPATAPIPSLPPVPLTGATGQSGQGGVAPAPVSKPVTAQSPATPIPPAQAAGSVKETSKPATSAGTPLKPVAAAAQPLPLAEAVDGYTYDPKSRREPFQSLTRLVKIDKTRLEMPPLQRVQLSDLKLLGIMWGGYGYYGLVRTPDGKGYTVKEGMLMGTNNGVISAITDKAVIVSEPSIDIAGNKSTKDVEILLRPKEVS